MSEMALGSALFVLIVLVLSLTVLGAQRMLAPARVCSVTVNGRRQLEARSFEKLLNLLCDAGIAIPSGCGGAGTCGLCRVTVRKGGGEPTPAELGRLRSADVRAGVRLACQLSVREDLEIEVPDELFGVTRFTATVRSNRTLTPFITELVLDLPEGRELGFRAGAFMQVTAPAFRMRFEDIEVSPPHGEVWRRLGVRALLVASAEPTTRAYSLANRPQDAGRLVFDVRLALPPPGSGAPPGIVSSYLFGLRPGALVEVAGPYGTFGVHDSDREMVFIGGGAGMAPLRAMIFEQLAREGPRRRLSFWYGARSKSELLYAEEFDRLAEEHPEFSWTAALSEPRPEEEWEGPTGFIHEVVYRLYLKDHPAPEACEYYLCGPPLMTHAVYAMLDDIGVDRDNIFNDDFGG